MLKEAPGVFQVPLSFKYYNMTKTLVKKVSFYAGIGMIFGAAFGKVAIGLVIGAAIGIILSKRKHSR